MRIVDLFDTQWIQMDLRAKDKWEAIQELGMLLHQGGQVTSLETFLSDVRAREDLGSTGVGKGIGIPHGKSSAVVSPSIAFGRSGSGIEFDSIDGDKVHLVFLLAVPEGTSDQDYMRTLARLARLLVHEEFVHGILAAGSPEEVLAAIARGERQGSKEVH
jgi:fructose-specific phosphotransferase system IIA component